MFNQGNTPKPVAEGEMHPVEIEDTGDQGDGIARINGFVVFVENAEIGWEGEVKITSVGSRFAFAEKAEE